MKSMTGYAYREFQNEQFQAVLEIKSFNNRYLDISVHLPHILNALEPQFRDRVKQVVSRGHVDVMIRYKCLESETEIHVDHNAVRQYEKAFNEIMDITGIQEPLSLSHFLGIEDILKPLNSRENSGHDELLLEIFDKLLLEYDGVRDAEGKSTRRDIEEQLKGFSGSFNTAAALAGELESSLRKMLEDRFEELLGSEYDQNRVLSEVAVMLVKYSVNEEIKRIESHLEQFIRYLAEPGSLGKKLDFLCQELNREINTIASKSTIAEVNQAVVVMKEHLENIREQLRNVE